MESPDHTKWEKVVERLYAWKIAWSIFVKKTFDLKITFIEAIGESLLRFFVVLSHRWTLRFTAKCLKGFSGNIKTHRRDIHERNFAQGVNDPDRLPSGSSAIEIQRKK